MHSNVSLVLPNFNNAPCIRDAIESILDTVGCEVELIVIDDGSTDTSREILRRMKGFKLIEKQHEGIARTLNLGFELAGQNDVVRLDGDIIVETSNWLEKLMEVSHAGPEAGIVGVKTVFPDGRLHCYGRSVVSALGLRDHHANIGGLEYDRGQYDALQPVDAVLGTMAYYRRDVVEAVRGIDEAFYPAWIEGDDVCIAARARGFDVYYQPAVKVFHLCDKRPKRPFENPKTEILKGHFQYWKQKWGWDPEFPDLHAIRRLWGHTKICWSIGEALLDPWEEATPLVDLLIVTWNNRPALAKCLDSLRETSYKDARVWILDNGSSDGTEAYLSNLEKETYPFPLHVVRTPVNIGLPAAMNWLVKTTDAPLAARLDDDVVLPPNWLAAMVQDLRRHPSAGVVAPKVNYLSDPQRLQFGHIRMWPSEQYHINEADQGQCDYLALTTHACGCCLLYRRKAFEKAGLFDIRYSPSQSDDLDHFVSIRAVGYDVLYDGTVSVLHPLTNGSDRSRKAEANAVANLHKLYGKWHEDIFEVLEHSLDLADPRNTHARTEGESGEASDREELSAIIDQLIEEGKLKEARAELERFVSAYPDHAKAHNDLGALNHGEGNLSRALWHFQQAIMLAPRDLTIRKNVADLHLELGQAEEALRICETILEEHPQDVDALLAVAEACTQINRVESAVEFYRKALEIDPSSVVARQGLESLADQRPDLWVATLPEDLYKSLFTKGLCQEPELQDMSVSIIVLAGDELPLTQKCLASILQNTEYLNYEVIIAETDSSRKVRDYLLGQESARVKLPPATSQQGPVQVCNAAAAAATGRFLVLLDSRVVVAKGWLQALLRTAASKQSVGAVTAKVVDREKRLVEAGFSTVGDGAVKGHGKGMSVELPQYNYVREIEHGSCLCMLVPKESFLESSGLDAEFTDPGIALMDLGRSLRLGGKALYYQPLGVLMLQGSTTTECLEVTEEFLEKARPVISVPLSGTNGHGGVPRKKVLVMGTYLANVPNTVEDMVLRFSESAKYQVTQRWVAVGGEPPSERVAQVTADKRLEKGPKFEILSQLLTQEDLSQYEYILVTDDDIVMPHNFLDPYLALQSDLEFAIAQPARTSGSTIDHPIVEQQLGILARQTRFVEIGPLVSFHRSVYDLVFPFDLTSPMGWGYENVWSHRLGERGLKMGIIDVLPVEHSLRPPVASYSRAQADQQRNAFLDTHEHLPYEDCFTVLEPINM